MVDVTHEVSTRTGVLDVRIHGRGGQGVLTLAEVLAAAVGLEGGTAHAYSVGVQRTGAPLPNLALAAGFAALTGAASLGSLLEAATGRMSRRYHRAATALAEEAYALARHRLEAAR